MPEGTVRIGSTENNTSDNNLNAFRQVHGNLFNDDNNTANVVRYRQRVETSTGEYPEQRVRYLRNEESIRNVSVRERAALGGSREYVIRYEEEVEEDEENMVNINGWSFQATNDPLYSSDEDIQQDTESSRDESSTPEIDCRLAGNDVSDGLYILKFVDRGLDGDLYVYLSPTDDIHDSEQFDIDRSLYDKLNRLDSTESEVKLYVENNKIVGIPKEVGK